MSLLETLLSLITDIDAEVSRKLTSQDSIQETKLPGFRKLNSLATPARSVSARVALRARATAYLVQTILSARILAHVYLVHTAIEQANEAGNISLDVVAAMSHRLASSVADDTAKK